MRKYLLSLIALVILVPSLGLAADMRTAEVVSKEENPKNLYLAGENPTVDANVLGDLVVAGGNVVVNGDVQYGVFAAGGNLNLNGKVAQSVRAAGGTVIIDGTVGGDVIVFGGDVILGTKSIISGDVLVFAGTATIKGEVAGNVRGYAGGVVISGKISGNVDLDQIGTLRLEPTAVIGGGLKYSSKTEGDISSDAKVGGKVEYTKLSSAGPQKLDFADRAGSLLFGALMAFVTLLVFIKIFPKFSVKMVSATMVNPWAKVGIGFLTLIVTPIVLLLLLITFVGWGVMGYLGLAYAVGLSLTGTITALFAGSFAWKYLNKGKVLEINWKTAAIGVILVALAKLIPIVGWIAAFGVSMMVFGTLVTMSFDYIKAQKA